MINDPLDIAHQIARRLVRDAMWSADRCTWLGWTNEIVDNQMMSVFRALGPNIYDGVAGIALFLGRLADHVNDRTIWRHAAGAAEQLLALSTSLADKGASDSGFYLGNFGVGFALFELGTRLQLEYMREAGLRCVRLSCAESSSNPDVLSGIAGKLLGLLLVCQHTTDSLPLLWAKAQADLLLDASRRENGARRWYMERISTDCALTGFSHGAAGVALALGKAAKILASTEYAQACSDALAYERSHFRFSAGNWRDLRPQADSRAMSKDRFEVSWCNGASGIGLSRLYLARHLAGECAVLEREVDIAAATTLSHMAENPHMNPSLCHGLSGNLEFLLEAATFKGNQSLFDAMGPHIDRLAGHGLDTGFSLQSGVISRQESPTLMLGLAGVGHFFLRLAKPHAVSSLLVIDTLP